LAFVDIPVQAGWMETCTYWYN